MYVILYVHNCTHVYMHDPQIHHDLFLAWGFQPLQRVVSTASYASHPSHGHPGHPGPWPCTPRFIGPGPGVQHPAVVHVVRELSPGRPPASMGAAQRALSPVVQALVPSMSGPVSPTVAQPRALSPQPTQVTVPSAHTPLMPGQQVVSPRPGTPCRLQTLSSHLASPRERALSPVGLPPVPVFAKVPIEGQVHRCPSPRPVVIKTTMTPRGMPTMRSTVPVMTPRPLQEPGKVTPMRQDVRVSPKPCVVRNTSRPTAKAPVAAVKRQASRARATTPSVVPPQQKNFKGTVSEFSADQTAAGQLPVCTCCSLFYLFLQRFMDLCHDFVLFRL